MVPPLFALPGFESSSQPTCREITGATQLKIDAAFARPSDPTLTPYRGRIAPSTPLKSGVGEADSRRRSLRSTQPTMEPADATQARNQTWLPDTEHMLTIDGLSRVEVR
ncbi:hypothetical protein MOKP64_12680 [Mycobacterium avium subsp. hominissuis]